MEVSVLLKIKFEHAQISALKIGIPISKQPVSTPGYISIPPKKRQKTKIFPTFSGSIEMKH